MARRRRRRAGAEPLVILTGLSGSGKGTILRTFEDLGYYCVDNLPVDLIPTFAELYFDSDDAARRAALLVDAREGAALRRFPALYDRLARRRRASLVFVEAGDAALLRRFSETRRPHPLGAGGSVREGVRRERALLAPIRARADLVVDTTDFTVHQLRQFILERFAGPPSRGPLRLSVMSFGYRYGVPPDADLVFDVRFLPNPNFVLALKPLTGNHARVTRYVFSFAAARRFVKRAGELLVFLLPHYIREGKSYLTIAFGCTGGRHRSVAIARALRARLEKSGHRAALLHRDLGKGA